MASTQAFSESCIIDESTFTTSSTIHYALLSHHPAGSISSSSNKIGLIAFTLDGQYSLLKECTIGGFTNQPDKYERYYSSENKPFNGYDKTAIHANTVYEGMGESFMYASDGKNTLYQSVNEAVNSNSCWRVAANFHGGNLNRDDNFWTYFCPKSALLDYIDSTIREKPTASNECWATYESGQLHIPCVKVKVPLGEDLKYEVDMKYQPLSEPMTFQLIGAQEKP